MAVLLFKQNTGNRRIWLARRLFLRSFMSKYRVSNITICFILFTVFSTPPSKQYRLSLTFLINFLVILIGILNFQIHPTLIFEISYSFTWEPRALCENLWLCVKAYGFVWELYLYNFVFFYGAIWSYHFIKSCKKLKIK